MRLRECTARLERQALASTLSLPSSMYGDYILTANGKSRFLLMLRRDMRLCRQHDLIQLCDTEHSYQNRGYPGLQGRIRLCKNLVFSARCLHLALLDFRHSTTDCRMHERRDIYGGKTPLDSILCPALFLCGTLV